MPLQFNEKKGLTGFIAGSSFLNIVGEEGDRIKTEWTLNLLVLIQSLTYGKTNNIRENRNDEDNDPKGVT